MYLYGLVRKEHAKRIHRPDPRNIDKLRLYFLSQDIQGSRPS